MKPKIHFHAGNTFWSGAEQMLTCLFSSERMYENFDMSFSYRLNDEFQSGLFKWLSITQNGTIERSPTFYPLRLFSSRFYGRIGRCFRLLAFWGDVWSICGVLKRARPDVLFINNGGYPGAISCNAAVLAGRLAKVPKIAYFVNNMPQRRHFVRRLVERPMDGFVSENVDVLLSGSHAVSKEMKEIFFHRPPEFKVIPNTIHRHPLEDREEVRGRLGVSSETVLIGSVGAFEERKGHVYLIRAFKRLWAESGPQMALLLVGEGSLREKYAYEAEKLIYLTASISNMYYKEPIQFIDDTLNSYSYINACDIYVQPSIEHEDFPISVLQAMSLGKPVVGTTVAGMPEQIDNGVTGYLARPKDVDSLKGCLGWLMEDYMRKALGDNAKKKFDECFSYDRVIQKYIDLYKGLV